MELLTKEILDKFRATGRQEDAGWEAKIIVKFFTPDANATWYLTEYDENDKCFFGLCDLGLGCLELGYVSLDELETFRGRFRLPVERDLHFGYDKKLSDIK